MASPPPPLPPDVVNALRNGQLIEAIKLLRKAKGVDLAQAKAIIDGHLRGGPTTHSKNITARRAQDLATKARDSHLSPGEVPRVPGTGFWIVAVLIAAALGAWYWVM